VPDVDGAVVARHAEELGFESIFYGEHPIRPVDQPGIGVHADGIPFFQDTLVMLARASAVTSRIKLGGAVFLIPQHNPVQFAKELASLDFYSGGRLIVGAGIGWSKVECELLGGHWDRRWTQTRETIQIMKRLWSESTVSYDGELYTVPPVQLFPQPATKPWPPVLLGATGRTATFERIVDYCDGWLPAFASDEQLDSGPRELEAGRAVLDAAAARAGRDPATLQVTAILRGSQVDGDLGARRRVDRAMLRRYESAGADRVLISMPTISSEPDAVRALTDIAESLP
jgi:probable F420-dependent oxidoreductase